MTDEPRIATGGHPEPAVLRDFALGRLDDAALGDEIDAHLERCESCQNAFLTVSESFGTPVDIGAEDETRRIGTARSGLTPEMASHIGRFKLLSELGRGGMGSVYLAEDPELHRLVAIKVLPASLSSATSRRRFRIERRITAHLSHPGIVPLLEEGTTPDGSAYLVVEFVPGTAIEEHCEQQQLNTEARLGIFLKVCDAVQHAHARGVIHRDLKPSNILVTPQGEPKIIDFGVGKVVHDALVAGDTLFTHHGEVIGTPMYMSPEQIGGTGGEPLDVRADVYSLGVVLYELLCGRLPFEYGGGTLYELGRTIREVTPPPRSANPSLPRELETIVLKAMAKARDQRYASASALAEDIRRFLSRRPILARRPSPLYRARKYIQRHPARVVVSTLAALALVTSIVLSIHARGVAASARERAIDSPVVAPFLGDPDARRAVFADVTCGIGADVTASLWVRDGQRDLLLVLLGLPENEMITCTLRTLGASAVVPIVEFTSGGDATVVVHVKLDRPIVNLDQLAITLVDRPGRSCTLRPASSLSALGMVPTERLVTTERGEAPRERPT